MLIRNRDYIVSTEADQEQVDLFIDYVLNAIDGNRIVDIIRKYEEFMTRFMNSHDGS